jgi:hypothetical protein
MKIMGVGRRCRVPIHAPTPQLYGMTQDASIKLSGRAVAPLEGTLRLAFASL